MGEFMQSGQVLARGVCRLLASYGYVTIEEFIPTRGLRVDVAALGPKGDIWVVECKSSRADFIGDNKWQGYLPWCDRYFWAVDADFDVDLLPATDGLIIADGYGGEILRMPDKKTLAAPRRKTITAKFARTAAQRLQALRDPQR